MVVVPAPTRVTVPSLATVATSGSYNDLLDKPAAMSITNTLASGELIATINGTNIYAPSYEDGDNLEYGG